MKNSIHQQCHTMAQRYYLFVIAFIFSNLWILSVSAQCVPTNGTIDGIVYSDANNNGVRNVTETGLAGVLVQVYDANGALLGSSTSDASGLYSFSGLEDGKKVRLVFNYGNTYFPALLGTNNGSSVQFVQVPMCNVGFGLATDVDMCNQKTEILTTCFVQGVTSIRQSEPTIVGIEYGFNNATPARKFAMHGETGSIWGLVWKHRTKEIFSSAFVKQHSGLKAGHDAIFRTVFNGSMYVTSVFTNLSSLGQSVGTLAETNIENCNYGAQVGKIGLGSMVISPDEKYLYVVNIYNNTIVRVSTENPTLANTISYQIPGSGTHAFALKYFNDKIYVGITKPGDAMSVLVFDPANGSFTNTGLSIPAGTSWDAPQVVGGTPAHWLTDIDFTDEGHMLLSLSDRIGHTFCNGTTNRLDEQKGDLMIAFKNSAGWTLEDRSVNGEFFSDDFWTTNPSYHSETTIGSIFAMPGTGSVVATVFDPEINSYSGGLHRYNTSTGKKEAGKELYTRETVNLFGKATGFGEIIATCGLPQIEIGNLVWFDYNSNGIQDAEESGISGVTVQLYDSNCQLLASILTDARGNYAFNNSNVTGGLYTDKTYFVGIADSHIDTETGYHKFGNEIYSLTPSIGEFPALNSDAVQTSCDNGLIAVNIARTSHHFDIGFKPEGECGLKITKRVVNSNNIKVNDVVNFEISVLNTGTNIISEVDITDKLPTGYLFDTNLNNGWVNENGVLKTTLNQRLTQGQTATTNLYLTFDKRIRNIQFNNEARISGVRDGAGIVIPNFVSCFKSENDGISNDLPQICDLALKHENDQEQLFLPNRNVTFTTTVCNQGTINASTYQITNYLNRDLDFDPSENDGWIISQDLTKLTFDENKVLLPGECRAYKLKVSVKPEIFTSRIVNYAEISRSSCIALGENYDFDSVPDDIKDNDKGGQPNTANDNEMYESGDIDEDDHDPAIILLDRLDLALEKSTNTRRVYPNSLVTFDIKVINQGNIPVSKVNLVDYIPDYFTLEDQNWTLVNGNAERMIEIPGNLQPGQSYITQCIMRVNSDAKAPLTIYNTAEIKEVYDQNSIDISKFDVDSTPDNGAAITENSNNINEDDISATYVVMITPADYVLCNNCRIATTPTNGQFETTIRVASRSGENWFVEESLGLFDFSSGPPPAVPTLLAEGFILTETAHPTPGHSYYVLNAVHLDGQGFSVRLRNEFGDLEQLEVQSNVCTFSKLNIKGNQSVCESSLTTYTANAPESGLIYNWFVDNISISGTSQSVNIDWSTYPSGIHEVKVTTGGCIAPAILNVAVGAAEGNSIACLGDFNVSLDGQCSMVITPQMLVAGSLSPTSPYIVILTDKHGNEIPNATLTSIHAGTKVMAKLMEGCGGNSCWSTITVEDKMPPLSVCRDIVLPCYKLDEYKGPFETDNCGGPVTNIIVNEDITVLTCNDEYVKYIDRVYQAKDKFGNKSELCNMRISLERPDFELIKFPPNYVMSKDSALVCDNFDKDEFGLPATSETGVPTLAGISLHPTFSEICNTVAWYKDIDHGTINCVRKITREWYVYEQWCSDGQMLKHKQLLEITDTIPPVILPIENFTVTTNAHHACEGNVNLPLPTVTDICSNKLRVDVTYGNGFITGLNQNNSLIVLPVGNHTITYTAYDECNNSKSITFSVTVEDKTSPTMICKGEVVVGLNSNGQAILYPRHIDDGTYDECGIEDMRISRISSNGIFELFSTYAEYDCKDVGDTIMTALRVWDYSGNSNLCMVNVIVQDKHAPQITCPSDTEIDCSDVFNGMDLTQYGNAIAVDACGATVEELAPKFTLNSCRVGTIERNFRAFDLSSSITCKQIITVGNSDYFNPLTHVIKPLDYEVFDRCSALDLHPDNLPALYGNPIITQSACGMAAASFKDDIYNFVTGACYKIVRNWTIIDWCEMDRLGTSYVPYTFQQIIKVQNTVPPFFVGKLPVDTTFFTEKGECTEGLVSLTFTGGDICTPNNQLRWSYKIDYNNNGTIDAGNNGFGHIASIINTIFPVGTHRILWSFEDQCGNVTTREHLVTVRNNDKPTAAGLESIAVAINPWDADGDGIPEIEKACIVASSLNTSSISLCCDEPLRFSFSSDVNDTTRCFNCIHVGEENVVELWVHDCNGNTDFIEVNVDVQDNNDSDVCELICVNNPAVATVTGTLNICSGGSTILTATGGVTYLWNTGETTASITVSPLSTRNYSVTITNPFRCSDSDTVTVNVNPLPNASIAGGNVCIGSSTVLTASGGGTYIWNNGATSASITVSPIVNTTYTVTVTNANGCTASTSRTVTVNPLPVASISGNNAICLGSSTTLTASGGGTYLWSFNNATTASINVSPAQSTVYTVTVTSAAGCSATSSINVTVNGLLVNAVIVGTNIICNGQSTTLTSSLTSGTVQSYRWNTNATTSAITVSPNTNTTYTVTITDINQCTYQASRLVTVNPLPTVNVTGPDICVNGTTTLTATGGGTYLWFNGSTAASVTVAPLVATTYSVTVTGTNGCSAVGSKLVNIFPMPTITIAGNDTICVNQSTVLTASGGSTYLWSNNATTASITVSPANTTTYTVTATDNNGCTNSQSITVVVNGLTINPLITGLDSLCIGSSVQLSASLIGGTATNYLWSFNSATTASITVSPVTTTTYTVTITDTNGCTASTNKVVKVLPLPNVVISGDLSICLGQNTTLQASGGTAYLWSNGLTTSSITVLPLVNTTFSVTVTDIKGCTNSTASTVVVNQLPNILITGNDTICANTSTILTASGATSYVWSTGATTASITVSPASATTYSVTGTDGVGCENDASILVIVNPNPTPIISGDLMICVGDTATLNVSGSGTFEWSTGETSSSIIVIPPVNTSYSVTVTDVNGCVGSSSATVVVDPGTLTCTAQDITVYLDNNGEANITPMDISTGSVGACANITATVNPAELFCNDIAQSPVTITLTVTNTNTQQSLTCTAQVTILDTLPPVLVCPSNMAIDCELYDPSAPLSNFGSPTLIENCPAFFTISEIPVINISNCNVGQITRTFTATSLTDTVQCVQLINVLDLNPFNATNITFPPDVTVSSCQAPTLALLGNVTIDVNSVSCSSITTTFSDNLPIPFCGGTYQRIWTVTDDCQTVPGTNQGIFTHTQVISVVNEIPIIVGPVDTVFLDKDPVTCFATYSGMNHTATGCNLTLSNNQNNNPNFDVTGNYPDGITVVQLIATSVCNEADTLEFVIVVDSLVESITCMKTYPIMTDILFVEESVYDHVTITQGCGTPQIVASYTNTFIYDTMTTYTCADLVNTPIGITIYFWYVGDVAPFTFCQSLVGLTDPNMHCDTTMRLVNGNIATENDQAVPHVSVDLNGSNMPLVNTEMTGQYAFPEMEAGGEYTVIPSRNDSPLEGVSTLDLIYIQKHILKTEELNSPYKIIAADINKDNKVTSADLVQLRKVILGIHENFPNNTSWRMIDKTYTFLDAKDPFMGSLAEKYYIESLNTSMKIDWVGVKIGDVNSSYVTKLKGDDIQNRNKSMYFTIPEQQMVNGKNIIPVYASTNAHIAGFQISLPMQAVNGVFISNGELNMIEDNYAFVNGMLNISWHDAKGVNVNEGDILFFLHVDAKADNKLSNVLFTDVKKGLTPEFYSSENEIKSLGWRVDRGNAEAFVLHGNTPNPWNNETAINFSLPEAGNVSLKIRDITGRTIYSTNNYFQKGQNSIRVSSEEIGVSGLLFYDLTYGNEIKTMKMLNIK
jgi:uncharacterized repeat protein (TIGR01451 family)